MGWNPWWLVERIHPSHHPKDPWKLWRGPWWSPPRQFRNRHRQWLGHVTPGLRQCSEIMVHGRSWNCSLLRLRKFLQFDQKRRGDECRSQKGISWLIQVLVDWLVRWGLWSTCHRWGTYSRLPMAKGFLVFSLQKMVKKRCICRFEDLFWRLDKGCRFRWDAPLLKPRYLKSPKKL